LTEIETLKNLKKKLDGNQQRKVSRLKEVQDELTIVNNVSQQRKL